MDGLVKYKNFITIEKDIAGLKTRIHQFIERDPLLNANYRLVEPIKGFRIITFATIVAETGGFELFKSQKQLVSYAG